MAEGKKLRLLPSLEVVAVSQAASPESNPIPRTRYNYRSPLNYG